ncbi:MAG: hypothetical protein GXP33_07705 [Spirochaetes bacterium]|nr:hypothetical protein [Spirochaetota bacterium]
MKYSTKTAIAIAVLLTATGSGLFAQTGPLAYILPAADKVIIVLGDTPRTVVSFNVYRRGPKDKSYRLLTDKPITSVKDPYKAAELMGSDFSWISKKIGSEDPSFVWSRLKADRNTTMALCLISHGLRMAMGRTYIDTKVRKGKSYRYRVVLLGLRGKEIKRTERQVTVKNPVSPPRPDKVKAGALDNEVKVTWSYSRYRGGESDRTVGFIIYRQEENGKLYRITNAPVLRVEGWLAYLDSTAENGRKYTYAVEAIDIIGVKSSMVYSNPVKPVDKRAPLVPMGLKAIDNKNGVILLWNISPEIDASYFNVFRSESLKADFVKINKIQVPVDKPKFLDKEAVGGRVYYYRVSAVDKSGNESKRSGPASIIPKDTTPPPPVINLASGVSEKDRKVTLGWEPSHAKDLKGYYIYRGTDKTKMTRIVGKPLKPQKKPEYRDEGYKGRGLQPGASLFYAVTSIDISGNESTRQYAEAKIPDNVPPSAVFSLTVKTTDDGKAELFWQPGLSRDLALHRIYRSGGKKFVKITELKKNIVSWTDKSAERGREYSYRVTEIDASGNESKPSRTVKIIPTDIVPPKPPSGILWDIAGWGISLHWNASSSDDVKGYIIYRAAYSGAKWKRLNIKPVNKLSFTDRWVKPGVTYGVSAEDTSGNESKKATVITKKKEEKK